MTDLFKLFRRRHNFKAIGPCETDSPGPWQRTTWKCSRCGFLVDAHNATASRLARVWTHVKCNRTEAFRWNIWNVQMTEWQLHGGPRPESSEEDFGGGLFRLGPP